MSRTAREELRLFLAERHPEIAALAEEAWDDDAGAFIARFETALTRQLGALPLDRNAETTPRHSWGERRNEFVGAVVEQIRGFFRRRELRDALTAKQRLELLWGMLLTRAVDNQLKALFVGGRVSYKGRGFQGKGFRSLGQEAIYGAPLLLRRGPSFRDAAGAWRGDVVAPLIRDLGAALCMRPERITVRSVLSAQMGKSGPPMDGRDLHIGDFDWGILPASAPLAISALTASGMALGFQRAGEARVAVTMIGDGGTSLGEWHEAINLCAARRLPAIFCVQNNQTALSTPLSDQTRVRVFADKAIGYGIPGVTIDGTDAEEIAAAFAWAAERARAGLGPALLELVSMRMCGHAHHDDMLYLGKEPAISWDYPELHAGGYADAEAFTAWRTRDPIQLQAARLREARLLPDGEFETMRERAEIWAREEAEAVIDAPWPDAATVSRGVFAVVPSQRSGRELESALTVETAPPFDARGKTFLEAIVLGIGDALERDPRVFLFGQDVGGRYGNAFLLLRPLLERYGDRILNSPLAEGAVLGGCIGAALAGQRPIAEMQFNDFVATGFNQLVNNAAQTHYRWGTSVPLVVRMPWGGLRSAGPFHSQNTEPWFYRTPGLKIVVPSTPHDARALLRTAIEDPDPVLFYEHIALYRDPRIKQALDEAAPDPIPLGRAALRRSGRHLAFISYGAYVHVCLRVAERLAADGIEAAVLDLRSLVPLDHEALAAVTRSTGRVLLVHEDSRTGGIGESLAAKLQEEFFDFLDAPIGVIGALDTPVPYSPPLEEAYLPSESRIEQAARGLAAR